MGIMFRGLGLAGWAFLFSEALLDGGLERFVWVHFWLMR